MKNSPNDIKGEEYIRFGKNVANARQKIGMSQKQISAKLNMPQSTYAGYESGTRKVPLSVIIKLSKILNKTADELIGINTDSSQNVIVRGIEKDIVMSYRKSDELDKALVRRTLKLDVNHPNQKNA